MGLASHVMDRRKGNVRGSGDPRAPGSRLIKGGTNPLEIRQTRIFLS